MSKQKLMQTLGLAQRANCLTSGTSLCLKAIQHRQVYLVIGASDLSDASLEKIKKSCQKQQIPFEQWLTREEISAAIGKQRSICAINNQGFAKSILKQKGTNGMNQ